MTVFFKDTKIELLEISNKKKHLKIIMCYVFFN